MPFSAQQPLQKIYSRLLAAFGPQNWWPGETQFEIIVGAILTQNTNWGNVEAAIKNLKKANVLNPQKLFSLSLTQLARLIRPSGCYNVKARRLKNFLTLLFKEYKGSLARMGKVPPADLRQKLLSVNGIGPETADSILLYAFEKPVFVVDAYTRRFLSRHGLCAHDTTYGEIQQIFMSALPADTASFNEYHALIVRLGKEFCRPQPRCEQCPLLSTATKHKL